MYDHDDDDDDDDDDETPFSYLIYMIYNLRSASHISYFSLLPLHPHTTTWIQAKQPIRCRLIPLNPRFSQPPPSSPLPQGLEVAVKTCIAIATAVLFCLLSQLLLLKPDPLAVLTGFWPHLSRERFYSIVGLLGAGVRPQEMYLAAQVGMGRLGGGGMFSVKVAMGRAVLFCPLPLSCYFLNPFRKPKYIHKSVRSNNRRYPKPNPHNGCSAPLLCPSFAGPVADPVGA